MSGQIPKAIRFQLGNEILSRLSHEELCLLGVTVNRHADDLCDLIIGMISDRGPYGPSAGESK